MDLDKLAEAGSQRQIFTVSQLNQRARQLLETHFSLAWVEGEISNLARPASGHWYFTLKDKTGQIRCAMFKNRNQRLRFEPENGMKVLLRGRLSIYEARGDYQLIAEHMEEAGLGALQRAFEQLKEKLTALGWFNPENKQELPTLPAHIGLVTSPTGAAVHDMITVLKRRFPGIPVTLLPVQVQGEGAAEQIAGAITMANEHAGQFEPPLDVLIVGRGGGSLEDLWAFNEEIVAQAIHASGLPIVSAVGHETDFTIADFVADYRAPTPSAAAELLSPDRDEWHKLLEHKQARLRALLEHRLANEGLKVKGLRERLKHPGRRLEEFAQRLDDGERRLGQTMTAKLAKLELLLSHQARQLDMLSPAGKLPALNEQVSQLQAKLGRELKTLLEEKRHALRRNMELLDSVSPLNTLERGYSIVTDDKGRVVKSASTLKPDDAINIRLSDGEVPAVVKE